MPARRELSVLSDDLKAQIQGAYRQFLNSKSLKPRLGQRLMIAPVSYTHLTLPTICSV